MNQMMETDPETSAAEVAADDAVLDALGGRDDQADALADDDELCALLRAYCADVDQPVPCLVSTRVALSVLRRARWAGRLGRVLRCFTRGTR